MGTRHLTIVPRSDNKGDLLCMYGQFNGYPSGHGAELKELLSGMKVVNGYQNKGKEANGLGCLAAQIVAHFKEGVGGVYIYAPGTRDVGEEFIYTIYDDKERGLCMRVQNGRVAFFGAPGTPQSEMGTLYDGPVDEFDASKAEGDDE